VEKERKRGVGVLPAGGAKGEGLGIKYAGSGREEEGKVPQAYPESSGDVDRHIRKESRTSRVDAHRREGNAGKLT